MKDSINELMIDKIKLNTNAHKKSSTWKPLIKKSAMRIIKTFINSRKIPQVSMVRRMVRIIKRGLTKVFSNAMTIAKMKAEERSVK
jgi:hypothetical protein